MFFGHVGFVDEAGQAMVSKRPTWKRILNKFLAEIRVGVKLYLNSMWKVQKGCILGPGAAVLSTLEHLMVELPG